MKDHKLEKGFPSLCCLFNSEVPLDFAVTMDQASGN